MVTKLAKEKGNVIYTGETMGIRELELIDIEAEEWPERKRSRRRAGKPKKGGEIEEWPMEQWAVKRQASWVEDEWTEEEWLEDEQAEDGDEWEENEWEDNEWEVQKRPAIRGRSEEYPPARRRKQKNLTAKRQAKERLEAKNIEVQEQKRRRKRRRRRVRIIRGMTTVLTLTMVVGALLGVAWLAIYAYTELTKEEVPTIATADVEKMPNQDIREWGQFYAMELERPELAVDLLTVNEYSRPGEALPEVKNIFIHYTANEGTTAEQNRSYFESLSESHERSASAHFVVGYDGTVVQCIPTKEIAYAVKGRNYDSISIECCYLKENGKFEEETYRSLIELTAWLIHKYELRPEDVLRHYDEGGKNCPKYYVEHEEAWRSFLTDLESYMANVSGS